MLQGRLSSEPEIGFYRQKQSKAKQQQQKVLYIFLRHVSSFLGWFQTGCVAKYDLDLPTFAVTGLQTRAATVGICSAGHGTQDLCTLSKQSTNRAVSPALERPISTLAILLNDSKSNADPKSILVYSILPITRADGIYEIGR